MKPLSYVKTYIPHKKYMYNIIHILTYNYTKLVDHVPKCLSMHNVQHTMHALGFYHDGHR